MTISKVTNPMTPPRAGPMVLESTGDVQITDGNVQAAETPVGVQNYSSVSGRGGASTEGLSTSKAEPVNRDIRNRLRRSLKKHDPQFVYSEDLPKDLVSAGRYFSIFMLIYSLFVLSVSSGTDFFCLRAVVFTMLSMIVL